MSSPDQAPPPVPDDDDCSPEPVPPGHTRAPDHPTEPDRAGPDWVRTELVRRTELIAAEHRAIAQAQARQAERLVELQLWSEEPQVASRLQGSLESVRLADRDAATLTEDQARAVAFGRWEDREVARRTIVSETACLLRLSERTVERLLDESLWLSSTTATFEALSAGEISYPHAKALIDQMRTLPEADQAAFEDAVLPHAKTLPVGRFTHRAHRLRERQHPESIVTRTRNALADRHTRWEAAADGMGWLHWYGTAHDTKSAFDRIDTTAKALQQHGDTGVASGSAADRGEAEQQRKRGLAQLRADITRALLLDGVTPDGLGAGIRGTVMITVPVLTLLGQSDEPATLEGYGPISPETAREIAAQAPSFTRLLTHPETGVVLSLGKTQYKNTKAMKKWLRMRDETCRFPGCNRPAAKSDVDHTDDWANGGTTDCDNLAHLCEAHHRLKHLSQWQVVQEPGGVLHWTSPGKRSYRTDPANPVATSYLMPEHRPQRRPTPPVPENPPF